MKATQVAIARRLKLDVSSVNKILHRKPGAVFRKDTIRKVFKVAESMGYDFGNLKHTHRRRDERHVVRIPAELAIYQGDGSVYDRGVATISELSDGGAQIEAVELPQGALPVEPFRVGIRPMNGDHHPEIRGRIVRYQMGKTASFGIEFDTNDLALEGKVRKIAKI